MQDWRLIDSPLYLKGASIKKIKFPDFWEKSFVIKNDFFKLIKSDAVNFVKTYGKGEDYLVEDKVQDFWHEHCVFCTDKITTRDHKECYCTEDYSTWICKSCYDDFKELFKLALKP